MPLQQALFRLKVKTKGKGFSDITPQLNGWITETGLSTGVLHLTALHTSCSLTVNENADPRVLEDLSSYLQALVPEEGYKSIDGNGPKRIYKHANEGLDDMPAHIRTSLTSTTITLSFKAGTLVLGTWQAVYLWEHRCNVYIREIHLHAIGEI